MRLGFGLQLAVIVITALSGTALVVSLFLLWFSLGGNPQFTTMSAIWATVAAAITVAGVIVLRVWKNEPLTSPPDQQGQVPNA